jgi:homoserine kinase type II
MAATTTCPVVTSATDATPEELLAAAAHFFPSVAGFTFRRASGGVNNKTFYVDTPTSATFVLRLYNNGRNEARVRYEHAALALLAPLSFSFAVPRFLPSLRAADGGATFATLADGGHACCAALIAGGPASGLAHARAIGSATAELVRGMAPLRLPEGLQPANPLYRNFYSAHHSITREAFMACARSDAALAAVRQAMDYLVAEIEATEAVLARIASLSPPLPQQLINADLHTDNVLVEGQRVTGVLDFEFAAIDWRCMELVVGVSKYCGAADPRPLLVEYIEGYRAGGGSFTAVEVELIPELIIMRILNNMYVHTLECAVGGGALGLSSLFLSPPCVTHTTLPLRALACNAECTLWGDTWRRRTALSPLQG